MSHMSEVGDHPVCMRLRQRVVDLFQVSLLEMDSYPLLLSSGMLTRKRLAYEMLAPICEDCPYIQCSIDQLAPVCPTAKFFGIRPLADEPVDEQAYEPEYEFQGRKGE